MLPTCLLTFILASPGFLAGSGAIFERIQIAGGLEIEAQYLPPGSVVESESMLLSIEDFAIVQAEVEGSVGACNSRLKNLTEQQQETIKQIQASCDERNATLKLNLAKALESKDRLEKDLEQARSDSRFQRWISIGLVVGGTVATTTYIVTR
jgi:hypothetical protein